jgi:TIR domain
MSGIFISYRREDSAGWTGRLAERLKQKFGAESIFMDIDTIQPGTDFAEALRSAVGACDVLLAMIGPEWSLAKNAEGQARLQDPNDWVRTELTTALSRSIPVIPVFVGGASLPKLATLPDDLKKLFQYQAHELTDKRWEYDSNQLVQVLQKVVRGAKPKRNIAQIILTGRSTWVALVILGIVLVLGAFQLRRHVSSTEDGTSQKNEARVSELSVATPPPESKPAEMPVSAVANPAEQPPEATADEQQSKVDQHKPASSVARPTATSQKSRSEKRIPSASSAVINLLSPENGGQIIVADTKDWSYTIDGNDKSYGYIGQWVVYGFKNDGSAMFDTFKVWIPGTAATNLKEFELLAGNDSPTGKFESIGKFQPQNLRFFKDPWQEFRFPPVKAKYLKLNVISTYGSIPAAYEFQLLGVLEK